MRYLKEHKPDRRAGGVFSLRANITSALGKAAKAGMRAVGAH